MVVIVICHSKSKGRSKNNRNIGAGVNLFFLCPVTKNLKPLLSVPNPAIYVVRAIKIFRTIHQRIRLAIRTEFLQQEGGGALSLM